MEKVNIISLGCSKNLIDTELLLKQFVQAGYQVEVDGQESDARIVVVNTCGFIAEARKESIYIVLEQVKKKRNGEIDKLFVMGCLSERYRLALEQEIPEVDAFFGKFDWKGILAQLGHVYNDRLRLKRYLTTPSHYAYLKIAEGCSRECSYCAIPQMTGKYQSRDFEEIIEEAEGLAGQGVKELLVVAQDITCYGEEKYGRNRLAELVDRLADIPGIEWIKLHYLYPAGFPWDLLRVMRERSNVCKYLDIPLQHGCDKILKLMRRGVTARQAEEMIERIRREVPGVFIRTTLITGHPGEKEEDFREMLDFIERVKFERLGVFSYSHEEGTFCDKHYMDDVPWTIKRRRANRVMERQLKIATELSSKLINTKMKVIVDKTDGGEYVARTQYDSPEVDPVVYIVSDRRLQQGEMVEVRVTGTHEYDLLAVYADESKKE